MKNFFVAPSPWGYLRMTYDNNSLYSFTILPTWEGEFGTPSTLTAQVCQQVEEYFKGERKTFTIPIKTEGTPFQEKVWQALRDIPYGETRSYGQIAATIGNPKASRAVGMANNKNPILIITPCHRVIGANGKLVGFGAGLPLKERLLELEANCKW